jgi:hypothetical protein
MDSMMKRGVSPLVTTPWSRLGSACHSIPVKSSNQTASVVMEVNFAEKLHSALHLPLLEATYR